MIKTCIIGVSGYGQIHYDLLLEAQAAGQVYIVGAAIINQDEELEKCALLRELGCSIFDDYELMLRELSGEADLCMIPTGTPLHRSMTVAALEAGMHVLVEKPAAGCLEDVRDMQAAAEKAGKIVAVGYQHMYAKSVMESKRHILQGTIGKLESIKCLVMWPRGHDYYSRNGWAGKLAVGDMVVNDSPFNNAVAHELMMMIFMAGTSARSAAMPVKVDAQLYRANAIESADTACMHVETGEGVPVRFYATHACRENFGPEIYIRGTTGSIVMTHKGSVIVPGRGNPIRLESGGGTEERKAMMDAVLDAVAGGSSFICDLGIASRQTMVVESIHKTCEIHPLESKTITQGEGAESTFIPGIEIEMRKAYDAELLLNVMK